MQITVFPNSKFRFFSLALKTLEAFQEVPIKFASYVERYKCVCNHTMHNADKIAIKTDECDATLSLSWLALSRVEPIFLINHSYCPNT